MGEIASQPVAGDDPFGDGGTVLPPPQMVEDVPPEEGDDFGEASESGLFPGDDQGQEETPEDEDGPEDDFDEEGDRLLERTLDDDNPSQAISIVITEPLFDAVAFRNRIDETTRLHRAVTKEVRDNLKAFIGDDPGMALAFLKESTNNLVKMMDVSRKISESAARSQAFLANMNKGRRLIRNADPAPAQPQQKIVPPPTQSPPVPTLEKEPETPPTMPAAVPGDLSASRFSELGK